MKNISFVRSLVLCALPACALSSYAFADCPNGSQISITINVDGTAKVVVPEGTKEYRTSFTTVVTPTSPIELDSTMFVSIYGKAEGPYNVVIPARYGSNNDGSDAGIICTYSVGLTPTGSDRPPNYIKLSIDNSIRQYFALSNGWTATEDTRPGHTPWTFSCDNRFDACGFSHLDGAF